MAPRGGMRRPPPSAARSAFLLAGPRALPAFPSAHSGQCEVVLTPAA